MSILEVKGISAVETEGVSLENISFCIDEKGIYGFFGKDSEQKTHTLESPLRRSRGRERGDILSRQRAFLKREKDRSDKKEDRLRSEKLLFFKGYDSCRGT